MFNLGINNKKETVLVNVDIIIYRDPATCKLYFTQKSPKPNKLMAHCFLVVEENNATPPCLSETILHFSHLGDVALSSKTNVSSLSLPTELKAPADSFLSTPSESGNYEPTPDSAIDTHIHVCFLFSSIFPAWSR